jgi:hypothetical protein
MLPKPDRSPASLRLRRPINLQIGRTDRVRLRQLVVPLAHDRNFVAIEGRFEQSDRVVRKKLSRNSPRDAIPVFLFGLAEGDVLNRLDRTEDVGAALRLHRHDVLRSPAIDPDIEFVDLDLTVVRNLRAQVAEWD